MNDSIWQTLLKLVVSFLTNKSEGNVGASIEIPLDTPKVENKGAIDWTNPESMISKYFRAKEALWLPSWQVLHIPSEEEKINILKQATKMDLIRDFLDTPINVHCWIRPILNNPSSTHHGQDYNALVKGAKNSSHKTGLATDYDAKNLNCDDVRAKLESKLEEWDIRMERMPGGNWIHNDCSSVVSTRYFNP